MATGIIGALSVSSSLTYTPATNAKVIVNCLGGSLIVNGVGISGSNSTGAGILATFYVGAGQSVTIATASTTTALVSAIEES
ncbi:MAG TPA: hypothetical protein VF472_07450 [Burkholderiaceae bacterium]